jgi:hypothetical protein
MTTRYTCAVRRRPTGQVRYDLVQKENSRQQSKQSARVYYGVTEDGIHGEWARLVGLESNTSVDAEG